MSAFQPSQRDAEAVDAARGERYLLMSLDAFLERRSPGFVVTLGVALVFLIGVLGVFFGPFLSLGLFYLAPVALVSWRLGWKAGGVIAALSTATWLAAELLGGIVSRGSPFPFVNAAFRFGVLFFVAGLVATLRAMLQAQRDVARLESRSADDLRALNQLKDTLLHAVSHDLRGPITAISGAVQTLSRAEQLELTPEQRAGLLTAIGVSARKLNRMVTDLLDLDRLDQGLVEPDRAPTDVGALARSVVGDADFLDEHPVRIVADPVMASVDAGKVERVIENLLTNAAKHTPLGTPVLVTVRQQGDDVVLSVEDEGPGIPDELKPHVFEPFRQGPAARRSGSGAGIGLSLVQRFAELHGGRAWVEDRDGGGTAFGVSFPGSVVHAIPPAGAVVRVAASAPTSL